MALRQLKIKTGVVQRLNKELICYEQEATQQRKKIEDLVAKKEDEYVIKKQREVLAETVNIIPDSKKQLREAFMELKALVDKPHADCKGTEELEKASQLLLQVTLDD